jgi:hypothetical protein
VAARRRRARAVGREMATADGGPSGVGGAGWAGLTRWELWGAAGGLWALLEGKTEIGGNLTITPVFAGRGPGLRS